MPEIPADITLLLHAAASGQRESVDALMAAIYEDLRGLAAHHMSRERPNHTLQPTAIVHEAYMRLIDQRNKDWKEREAKAHTAGRARYLPMAFDWRTPEQGDKKFR